MNRSNQPALVLSVEVLCLRQLGEMLTHTIRIRGDAVEKTKSFHSLINGHVPTAHCFASRFARGLQQCCVQGKIDDIGHPKIVPKALLWNRDGGFSLRRWQRVMVGGFPQSDLMRQAGIRRRFRARFSPRW